ncbi:DNA polymerase III subunit alpha [Alteribacillus bidgolensis]|uniref:DNA polymerase III subunit alpha n=1 Tax=Alteribacillus bidgolensis TaxID=930129 RepID=A0A1G8EWW6_9BACI|nr:DNA polymerase III subunit alpha [Alteribacillus bidgolensis]SDH74345.1 DNA polymerase-3 subunit alpha [Alteribacillus bidgolensis]
MEFVHLHTHTEYSLLESTARIRTLVNKAADDNMSALAITDKNNMHGVIPFYKQCIEKEIKPIIGLELWMTGLELEGDYPIILLAENNEGYRALLKLSTIKQTEGYIHFQTAAERIKDCFILLPYADSEVAELIRQDEQNKAAEVLERYIKALDKGRVYLEKQPVHGESNVWNVWEQLSLQSNVPFAAGNNIHMADEEEKEGLYALKAIAEGTAIKNIKARSDYLSGHFLYTDEITEAFGGEKGSLLKTAEIAAKCNVKIDFEQTLLPKFPLPTGHSAKQELRRLCDEGAAYRYNEITDKITERLDYELQVIDRMGFNDYFLIVADLVRYARNQGMLVGPGRGSAAGSLVSYVLEITDVDPLEHDLLFERFLNPERVTMPDIDIDFPDYRRDEVIKYVVEKYGKQRVAQIVTFGTFGARASIRDAGRIMEAPQALIDRMASFIPQEPGMTLKKAYKADVSLQELIQREPQAASILKLASKIEGLPRHTSVHAAGVVMSEDLLTEHVPLMHKGDDFLLTQYPMDHLEEIGLLKMDFLGLKNLSLLERITRTIKKQEGTTIYLRDLPADDSKTYAMLAEGDTTGVFQLESTGMRQALQQIKPTAFEDIAAVNALYRPGPMENIPVYAKRKHGHSAPDYPHDRIKHILAPTYGVIVYQEQIMQIASEMAGYSFGEADLLRRAVSKKNRKILETERDRFVTGAEKTGCTPSEASKVYDLIVRFADYGFNRSHAVAYSFIAYQLAYLKTHYPAYFYAALLTMNMNNPSKTAAYLREAKQKGLTVNPPSIHRSEAGFYAARNHIYFGLLAIKQVNIHFVRSILEERKHGDFQGMIDFIVRMDPKVINRRALESLIKAGALDDFANNRAVMLASIERAIEFAEFQKDLGGLISEGEYDFRFVQTKPFSENECFEAEKEATGFYLSGHPLDRYQKILARFQPVSLFDRLPASQRKVWAAGIVEEMKQVRTKNGQSMAFLTITDGTGDMEIVIFPNIYRKIRKMLTEQIPILIGGRQDRKSKKQKLLADHVLYLEDILKQSDDLLFLKIEKQKNEKTAAEKIKQILGKYPGGVQVCLVYEQENKVIKLADRFRTDGSTPCLEELKQILGEEFVVLKKA